MSGIFSAKPPKVEKEQEVSSLEREREALLKRSRVDANTTVAGSSSSDAKTFRSTLGR